MLTIFFFFPVGKVVRYNTALARFRDNPDYIRSKRGLYIHDIYAYLILTFLLVLSLHHWFTNKKKLPYCYYYKRVLILANIGDLVIL